MVVDVNELKRVKGYLDAINRADFKSITWVEDGQACVIPNAEKTIAQWDFVGMNNTDFVFTGCYKDGFMEEVMEEDFMTRLIEGAIPPTAIDEAIEKWHNGDYTDPLHKFLGMSEEEYNAWVQDPKALDQIVENRKRCLAKEADDRKAPAMSDLERIEAEWVRLGYSYHKVTSATGWVGIGRMGELDRPGVIYVSGYGHVSLTDYSQLGDFLEFDPSGARASASDRYTEWWNWLRQPGV